MMIKKMKIKKMIEYENEKLVRCSIAVVSGSKNKFKPTRIATVAKENY